MRASYHVNSLIISALAYFVSPHGFGHAARACAVIQEIQKRLPEFRFEIYTEVPQWFFSESLRCQFTYHRIASDVGLVQKTPLEEDLSATVDQLDHSLLRKQDEFNRLCLGVQRLRCKAVIADISPLGLAVARNLGLPSVLVENFTWDWIYKGYPNAPEKLRLHGQQLADIFAYANLRIQTEPYCLEAAEAITVPPVARNPRCSRQEIRRRLGVPLDQPMVLLSMGGVRWEYGILDDLENQNRCWIVVPGGARKTRRRGQLVVLPFHADFYHPDLVHASDLVVGKLGYSTVAETYAAGAAYGYITRSRFPESPILEKFVCAQLASSEISEKSFRDGTWIEGIGHLLEGSRKSIHRTASGAELAARAILDFLES